MGDDERFRAVQHIRRRFPQQRSEQFTSIVEQAPGRVVRSFVDDFDRHADEGQDSGAP